MKPIKVLVVIMLLLLQLQIAYAITPSATLEYYRIKLLETSNDYVPASQYLTRLENILSILNNDDDSNTTLGDVSIEVYTTDPIEDIWMEDYAILNTDHVVWLFNTSIPEDDSLCCMGFYMGEEEVVYIPVSISRNVNTTVLEDGSCQLINVTVKFYDTNFFWSWLDIEKEYDGVRYSITPISIDAPGFVEEDNEVNFRYSFNLSQIEIGKDYHFLLLATVSTDFPILAAKPCIHLGLQTSYEELVVGVGYQAAYPSELLPPNIVSINVTTNVSNAWNVTKVENIEVIMSESVLDISDATYVAYMLTGRVEPDLAVDFNHNGRIDIGDLAKLSYFLVGKISFI